MALLRIWSILKVYSNYDRDSVMFLHLYLYLYRNQKRRYECQRSSTRIGQLSLEGLHTHDIVIVIIIYVCLSLCSPGSVNADHVFRTLSSTLHHALSTHPYNDSWMILQAEIHHGIH